MHFQKIFGKPPETKASAPGRVNLLGEHTDYNDGFVLPTAIPQHTTVQAGFSTDGQHHFYSEDLEEEVSITEGNYTPSGFASYIFGCIQLLRKAGYDTPSLNLYVKSTVPMGSGLSSSAALEVATLRTVRQLLNLHINDVEIAQLAQQAEIHYAGVQCISWCICGVINTIMTAGRNWAIPVGVTRMYCPTSRNLRTSNAVPANITVLVGS
ncbi:hypothetical protein NUACC21_04450 [Scytonema sp. NUACC21]